MNSLTTEYLQQIKNLEAVCSECKAKDSIFYDETAGTRVCKGCGTVHEMNMIDETSEWRNFGGESSGADMNRVGGPVNTFLESGGISAVITGQGDQRLANANNRIISNVKDKNKMKGWAIIKDLGRDIHISKQVIQEAIELFSRVEDTYYLKGKKMILKVASVIMIASRKSKLPKNMKDILKGADISRKELSKCYRLIMRKVCPNIDTGLKPKECILQIASRLDLNGEVEDKCKEVADFLQKKEYLTGRSPFTVAGVAVYLVTQLDEKVAKNFKSIGVAAKLADATIRNAYKILYPFRYDILGKYASNDAIDKALVNPK